MARFTRKPRELKHAYVNAVLRQGHVATIATIQRAYVRRYWDNGQVKAYVEWTDTKGETGRTEGPADPKSRKPIGPHMQALFARAEREGITVTHEGFDT